MNGILTLIVIGLVAAFLVSLFNRSRGFNILSNLIIGIVTAVLVGFVVEAASGSPNPFASSSLLSLALAFIVALLVVAAVKFLPFKRGT